MHNYFTAKRVGAHLLFWLLVFGIWLFLRYQDYAQLQTAVQVTAVKVLDLALLVYITNRILLPRYLYQRRYLLFVCLFLGMVVLSSVLKMQILSWLQGGELFRFSSGSIRQRFYDNVLPHFFLVAAGAAIQLIFDYRKLQLRLAEIGREKAEAEIAFLKSQINPHFIFNSLNTVYFMIEKSNSDARDALHRFSEMLRYQLYEMNAEKISVEKEWRFLQDYVALQQIRRSELYDFQMTREQDLQAFEISPLLLMPFVENAFKHLSHYSDRTNFVKISLSLTNSALRFQVVNSVQPMQKTEVGGIGLSNVKRRLELLYPEKYRLRIEPETGQYKVVLELDLSKQDPIALPLLNPSERSDSNPAFKTQTEPS